MIKRYVKDIDTLKSMSNEDVYQLYHRTEFLIGSSDSINYIKKVLKKWNNKNK
jgi:hypothetical protein